MLLHLTPTETVEPLVVTPDRLVVEVRWQGGHGRPPRHLHPGHDERFEIRQGQVAAVIGRVERVYGPGEGFDAPRGSVHSMWPVDGPATATWECRPAGRSLQWFEELDRLTARGLRGPALVLARGAAAGRYDDVFQLAAHPRPVLRAALRVLSRFG